MTAHVTQADREAASALWDATDGLWDVTHEQVAQLVANTRLATEAACLAGCEIYLKPGQTPAARMKQDHEGILGLMKLLEKTKWALQDAVRTNVENCRQRDWWMNAHATIEAELTANERKVDELIATEAKAKAREDALVEALAVIRGLLSHCDGKPSLEGDAFKIADATIAAHREGGDA